jgi:hypothetical protein
VPNVASVVLESRVPRIGIERCRRAVNAAAHRPADRHHRARGAVIGPLAAVLLDTPAEFRELKDQRFPEQPLVAQVGVERKEPVADRRHQRRVAAAAGVALRGVRVEPAGLDPIHARARAAHERTGNRTQRKRETIVGVRRRARVGGHGRDLVQRREGGLC